MKISGAVLERIDAGRPYADSRPLQISQLELDPPGPNEVLVRVEAAGLCHSDLSVLSGDRPRPIPMLLGHEAAGCVEEVGSSVEDLRPGQRVVLTFLPRCGDCDTCRSSGVTPCTAGSQANGAGELLGGGVRLHRDGERVRHHLGVSAFATHAVVNRSSLVPVDDDVTSEVAAVLGCAVLTGGGAVMNVGRPEPGQTVVVVGLGGVGMAALLTALSYADVRVIGVDLVEERLANAHRLGAHSVLRPSEALEQQVEAQLVVESAGSAQAVETAISLTGPGGATVLVGLTNPRERTSISPLELVVEGRSLVGSYMGSSIPSRDIPRFVNLWRSGRLPIEELITSTLALSDINAGMDQLADAKGIRQIVKPNL
jgi:alcohol dehydrogenase